MISRVNFQVAPLQDGYPKAITPIIDGVTLVDLISQFEHRCGFEPAGGYAGIVPEYFNFGDLHDYFVGQFSPGSYFANLGAVYLLGCGCGEVGCWPFCARIVASSDTITWDHFSQPYRSTRDYSNFGPFTFERSQYEAELQEMGLRLRSNP